MRRFKIPGIIIFVLLVLCGFISCRHTTNENISHDKTLSFHGIPRPDSFVSDSDSILTFFQYDYLNEASMELKRDANVSLVNLIVKKSGVENFKKEFADSIFNIWGIGDSITNRGLLIAISIDDRSLAIVIGLGLEQECSDSLCEEIIQDMIPYCREGEYYKALEVGTTEIKKVFQ